MIESQDNWIMSPGKVVEGTIIGQLLDPKSKEGEHAQRIYTDDLCHKCGWRKGTMLWGSSALDTIHGGRSKRCDVCAYSAQLAHAFDRLKAIPNLIYKLCVAYLRSH